MKLNYFILDFETLADSTRHAPSSFRTPRHLPTPKVVPRPTPAELFGLVFYLVGALFHSGCRSIGALLYPLPGFVCTGLDRLSGTLRRILCGIFGLVPRLLQVV